MKSHTFEFGCPSLLPGEKGTSRIRLIVTFDSESIGWLEKHKNLEKSVEVGESHQIQVLGSPSEYVADTLKSDFGKKTSSYTIKDSETKCFSTITAKVGASYPLAKTRIYLPAPGVGGDAFGPLIDTEVNPAPQINFTVTWNIYKHKDGSIRVYGNGSHNLFPAYESLANGKVIYKDYPEDNGPGIVNLGIRWQAFNIEETEVHQ